MSDLLVTTASVGVNTHFSYDIPATYEEALVRGLAAAKLIGKGASITNWLDASYLINEGSKIAAEEAGAERGRGYNTAFNKWLAQYPDLRAVEGAERAAAIWCLREENWQRAQDYLHMLTPRQLARANMRAVKRHIDETPAKGPKEQTVVESLRSRLRDAEQQLDEAYRHTAEAAAKESAPFQWWSDTPSKIADDMSRSDRTKARAVAKLILAWEAPVVRKKKMADERSEKVAKRNATKASADALIDTVVEAQEAKPAVPIKDSIRDGYIICLEDGRRFKSLTRHLRKYNLSPEEYREKWGLPPDYPMTAPAPAPKMTFGFDDVRRVQRQMRQRLKAGDA